MRLTILMVILPLISIVRFALLHPSDDYEDIQSDMLLLLAAGKQSQSKATSRRRNGINVEKMKAVTHKKRSEEVEEDSLSPHARNLGVRSTTGTRSNASVHIPLVYPRESSKPSSGGYAIFYNIYMPHTEEGQENALRIVREQIRQIKTSFAATSLSFQRRFQYNLTKEARAASTKKSPLRFPMNLYYVTIGASKILTQQLMQEEYCGPFLNCQHVQHFDQGTEVVTLQHVYDFCQNYPSSSSLVTYLHNKGSFHYSEVNENWRPALTDAALSDLCLSQALFSSSNHSSPCNICGLQFYNQWAPFIPGNMFSARCDYIRQLLPPRDFSKHMEAAIAKVVHLLLKGQLLATILPDRKDFYGLDRYSDEHWIASHPDVVPCDCDPTRVLATYHDQRKTLSDLELQVTPLKLNPPSYSKQVVTFRVKSQTKLRVREYYYLPGNLIKWFHLYQKAPGSDSWVWRHFPDGTMWQDAVTKHQSDAVNQVTKVFASESVLTEPTFAPDRSLMHVVTEADPNASESPVVFFFDMVLIPTEKPLENVADKLSHIQEQLDIVTASASLTKILYTTSGQSVAQETICAGAKNATCLHLKHNEQDHRGETLRHLYEYCRHHPARRVVYIHNRQPWRLITRDAEKRARMIKHLTAAATSDMCLNALLDKNQCNVCGLSFFTLHTFHMFNNIWSSHCSYINQLLSPVEFESRMQDVITKAMFQKIYTRINFGIMGERVENLGVGGYAMEHWIGSHPNLLPCDLTNQSLSFWLNYARNPVPKFALHKSPHVRGAPFSSDVLANEDRVRANERLRMREYHLLPGNLLKWFELYGKAPSASSWIWSFYPDAMEWSNAVAKYGSTAVEVVTKKYELTEVEVDQVWQERHNITSVIA